MRRSRLVVLGLALVGVGVGVFVMQQERGPAGGEGEASPVVGVAEAPRDRGRVEAEAGAEPERAAKVEAPPVEARDRDRVAWSRAREQIGEALERRASSPAGKAPSRDEGSDDAPPQGTLSKEYIRERVHEDVLPLVKECYDNLLEAKPSTGGRMVLKFAIMGDESVGGIVDGVELAEESEIEDADFRECLTESTMSAVFDPPEGGGRVEITYPFVFEVEPDAEAPTPG